MKNYFAAPPTIGGPSHEGTLENTRYRNGVIVRKLQRSQGGLVRYLTASFSISGHLGGSGKIRVWYVRASNVGQDNITIRTFATFLRPGDMADYNILKDVPSNQILQGGERLGYFDVAFNAQIQGDGLFAVVMDFQSLDDDETYLAGIELILN